jgi:cytochrome b
MVEVWDLPLRIFHWALAASVLIAWFSANILDTVHEIAGYTVLVLIAFRIVWGFTGTRYSRFQNSVQSLRTVLLHLWQFAHGQSGRYLGLNPAGAAMSYALLVLLAVSTVSGWMQITERFFGVDWVEKLHTYSSNLVLLLAVLHVLGVLLTCALQKENLVRAMITGKKRARDE